MLTAPRASWDVRARMRRLCPVATLALALFADVLRAWAQCGDVNGDGVVNIGDALVVAQFDVSLRECHVAPFVDPEQCDVNADGACDIGDALRLAQCDVGLVSCTFDCAPFSCSAATTTTTTSTNFSTTSTTLQTCCKCCSTGKACGDSCITMMDTCHLPPGCACDSSSGRCSS